MKSDKILVIFSISRSLKRLPNNITITYFECKLLWMSADLCVKRTKTRTNRIYFEKREHISSGVWVSAYGIGNRQTPHICSWAAAAQCRRCILQFMFAWRIRVLFKQIQHQPRTHYTHFLLPTPYDETPQLKKMKKIHWLHVSPDLDLNTPRMFYFLFSAVFVLSHWSFGCVKVNRVSFVIPYPKGKCDTEPALTNLISWLDLVILKNESHRFFF